MTRSHPTTLLTILLTHVTLLAAGCTSLPTDEAADASPAIETEATRRPTRTQSPTSPRDEAKTIAAIDEDGAIFFPSAVTLVNDAGKEKLQRHAARIKEAPGIIVTLTGHTDDQGSRNYNLAIAEQRTLAVERLLRSYGVPARQIRRYSAGSEKVPKACRSAECRAKMRRVDLDYSTE
ncbi:OmpA family protein [Propionivibrio limicola]|uniref:OmpA family protein n=1 Tax=Propionivibrio limicola TaxID=167645 RepID=UPI0014794363|nr:OmpA family protein [Propionivibrio limicola]